jgi:hypothetical protein
MFIAADFARPGRRPRSAGQGVSAGEFGELIRAGASYANVRGTLSPGGEIRGQIK